MQKIYERINWENEPSTNTAISEDNLNKMDYALDQLDDRVINLAGYEERAKASEESARNSASNAELSESNALDYANSASKSESNAKASATNAATSEDNASSSANAAKVSENNTKTSETNAANSASNAEISEANALTYSQNAAASEANALTYANEAEASKNAIKDSEAITEANAILSQSYAVGGTGTRENEEIDNSKYYAEQSQKAAQKAENIVDGLDGIFFPIGSKTFEELASLEPLPGYTYNITNDFVTDDTFDCGSGITYPAGTDVYYTQDGKWSCFAGKYVFSVNGKKGAVNLTASDVGAVATDGDIAENTVTYTEATELTELTSGEKLTTAFGKIKLAVKNVIFIAKLLGSTDISKIGDGTVTGILSTLNSNIANLSVNKQDASTAITTSNIAAQSVNYATSAGNADTVDGYHASSFASSTHNHNTSYLLRTEWGRASGKLLLTYNHTIGSYSIAGGDRLDISGKSLAISGYTPIGIVGAEFSDKRIGIVQAALTDAGVFSGTLRNFASSNYNGTLYVKVLYIKNI